MSCGCVDLLKVRGSVIIDYQTLEGRDVLNIQGHDSLSPMVFDGFLKCPRIVMNACRLAKSITQRGGEKIACGI